MRGVNADGLGTASRATCRARMAVRRSRSQSPSTRARRVEVDMTLSDIVFRGGGSGSVKSHLKATSADTRRSTS